MTTYTITYNDPKFGRGRLHTSNPGIARKELEARGCKIIEQRRQPSHNSELDEQHMRAWEQKRGYRE